MQPDSPIDTVHMHHCVERWQKGDRSAADELLHTVGARLEHLTRKMLHGFPRVREWAETVDVLQGSLMRLLNTLQKMCPESTRHFFNLAAVHIRRELLDLARRFKTEKFTHLTPPCRADASHSEPAVESADRNAVDGDLDLWCRFHEAVDQLPALEREVLGLVFYHGWTQAQIAELFQVDDHPQALAIGLLPAPSPGGGRTAAGLSFRADGATPRSGLTFVKVEHARFGAAQGIRIALASGAYRAEATDGRWAMVVQGLIPGEDPPWPGFRDLPPLAC